MGNDKILQGHLYDPSLERSESDTMGYADLLQYLQEQVTSRFSATDPSLPLSLCLSKKIKSHFQSLFPDHVEMGNEEILLLLITLVPHLDAGFYDRLYLALFGEGNFPLLGGVRGKQHRGIIPTGEMALYLLAGENLNQRVKLQQELFQNSWLFTKNILYLEAPLPGEPSLSGKLLMQDEYISLFLHKALGKPAFGIDFPAQRINTLQEWDDLVLHPTTRQQVQHLEQWLQYGQSLLTDWGLGKKVKLGYRVLFYGPPGTGKTLTASLLGKYTQREVYRIDLSMVVSKYIGETEKNLSKLFNKAEHKNWILFFDEADALFGKRTGVQDSHDRYANQEISYLLQRIEDYDGLVILASNLKENIDEAFLRRFQAIIHFPFPRPVERLQLWEKAFPEKLKPCGEVNLKNMAERFELTGADIINVVHFCCLQAVASQLPSISQEKLFAGVQRELLKLGKKN